MEGGERMMENYTEIPVELNKPDSRDMEEMQKQLIDMITKNEKLKEKNEYLQKEVEDAKAVGERALCEVQELIAKNKRLVEEHNRQNGTIQGSVDIGTLKEGEEKYKSLSFNIIGVNPL